MELHEAIKAVAGDGFKTCTIETDGTKAGTTIKVNGKAIADLRVFSFSFWNDDYGNNVSLGFSTAAPASGPGNFSTTTYFTLVPPTEESANAAMMMNFDMCKKNGGKMSTVNGAPCCILDGKQYFQKTSKAKAELVVASEAPLNLAPRGQNHRSEFAQIGVPK
jgi:hypothetical protein